MNFNVYLPDELGQRAKDEQLKLSRLLRDAVIKELTRKDAMTAVLGEPSTFEVDMLTEDGAAYTGRIKGKQLIEADVAGPFDVYVTEDHRVILYHPDDKMVHTYETVGDELVNVLKDALTGPEFIRACQALGIPPVVDL